jgi:hypothetical protein
MPCVRNNGWLKLSHASGSLDAEFLTAPSLPQGNYVKDLEKIDRDISQIIIVDNSPLSFLFQEANAIGCTRYGPHAHRSIRHLPFP